MSPETCPNRQPIKDGYAAYCKMKGGTVSRGVCLHCLGLSTTTPTPIPSSQLLLSHSKKSGEICLKCTHQQGFTEDGLHVLCEGSIRGCDGIRKTGFVLLSGSGCPRGFWGKAHKTDSDLWGPFLWAKFHIFPRHKFIATEERHQWYLKEFPAMVPCGECKVYYLSLVEAYPPDLSSPKAEFCWTVFIHNCNNRKLGKPEWTVSNAEERWWPKPVNPDPYVAATD